MGNITCIAPTKEIKELHRELNSKNSAVQSIEVKGENISSKGSALARKLTNPGNNIQVEYKGRIYRNAEHAYQTWKSGEFDEVAYNSKAFKPVGRKPVNKATSFNTMVEILTAKLEQHPELIEEINAKGGLAYLQNSWHSVTGDQFWEKEGNFIKALVEAYKAAAPQTSASESRKRIEVSNTGYRKGDPQRNSDVDYVFTENAEAYIMSQNTGTAETGTLLPSTWLEALDKFPNKGRTKLNVSDVNGTNQAGIRTDNKGNISSNAYGIVVKKYQQDANGRFVAKEGQFQDTDEDFSLFVRLNKDMFQRLSESSNKNIIFPSQMALGKAALPRRFAEWLQNQLLTKFGVSSTIEKNQRADYDGYGLRLDSVASQTPSSETVSMEQILDYIKEFCAAKHIPQKFWDRYRNEAFDYVRQRAKGEMPQITPYKDIEMAGLILDDMVDYFKSVVEESPDFKNDHTYYTIGADGKKRKADISVTAFAKRVFDTFSIKAYRNERRQDVSNPGMIIGSSFDVLTRDFFNNDIKDSYPNMSPVMKEALVQQLNRVKDYFNRRFPDGWKAVANPFPIAAVLTDYTGERFSIAGETDLIITDSSGNLYIYDMKTTGRGKNSEELIDFYSNQLSLYRKIWQTAFPIVNIPELGLIVADTKYPAGRLGNEYTEIDGQLYFNGKPIQEFSSDEYSINLRFVSNGFSPVGIAPTADVRALEMDSLTAEELDTLRDSPLGGLFASDGAMQDAMDKLASERQTDNATMQDVEMPIYGILPRAKYRLGVKLAKLLSRVVQDLKTNDAAREELFPDMPENAFIGKSNKEIINPTTLPVLMEFLKTTYFLGPDNISQDSLPYVKAAQDWMRDNFNELLTAAPTALLNEVGITATFETEEYAEENPDELSQEEESDRESWAIDNREIEVEKRMPEVLKDILSSLFKINYIKAEDSEGNFVWEENGYSFDEFGVIDFLDRKEVVSGLLDGLHTAMTGEEMIQRLQDESLVAKYSWYPQIAQLLIDNPEIQSIFYSVFRTNKTNYTTTYVSNRPGTEVQKASEVLYSRDLLTSNKRGEILGTFKQNIIRGDSKLFITDGDLGIGIVKTNREVAGEILDTLRRNRGETVRERGILSDILEQLGFRDLSNFIQSTSRSTIKKIGNHVRDLVIAANNMGKSSYIPWEGSPLQTNKRDSLSLLVSSLADALPISVNASSVFNAGKTYQVYTLPSYLGDLIEGFNDPYHIAEGTNTETHVKQYIDDRYGKSPQTCYIYNGEKTFVSSWIQDMYRHPEDALMLKHLVETSGLGKQYKDMNLYSYPLSAMAQYFIGGKIGDREFVERANFYVPIRSDKNSSEYIHFKKYSFREGRSKVNKGLIAEDATNIMMYEIIRMRDVFRREIDGTPYIDTYSSEIPKSVVDKLRSGKRLTFSDILDKGNLKPFMKTGGSAFRFFTFMNNEFTSKTKLGKAILDYISGVSDLSIELHDALKEAFIEHMDSRFVNSFLPYVSNLNIDNAQWFNQQLTGFPELNDALEEFYWNSTLASANILAMTIIDPAFYSNATQVQKRYAQVHAMTSRVDKTAKFIDNNGNTRQLSDGQHRFIIIDDVTMATESLDIINRFYENQISRTDDRDRKNYLRSLQNTAMNLLKDIKFTDGQGMTSVDGFFKKMGMLGVLTPDFKESYYNILEGNFTNADLQQVYNVVKPFVFSWENISEDIDSPFYVPLQIKDSEYVLMMLPAMVDNLKRNGVLGDDNLLANLFDYMHQSAYTNNEWNGGGIDTIVFASAVKGGATNVLSQEKLKEILDNDPEELWDYVHLHDFYDWGKQQEVPNHLQDHEQSMPSQTRVLIPSKLDRNSSLTYNGKTVNTGVVIDRYNSAIAEDMGLGIDEVVRMFSLDKSNLRRTKSVSDYLKSRALKDNRTTGEEYKAVSLRNGEFNVPLGDPINMERHVNNILSAIKKKVNKELIPGGPTVQVSPFGYNMPKIVFDDNGNLKYFEIYCTFPSAELERKFTPKPGSRIWKRLTAQEKVDAQKGLPLSVNRGLQLGLITEDDLKVIASRIPVEEKYSIWPMRIASFLPRVMGEYAVIPPELVVLSGGDFDIDKIYIELKYTKSKGDSMTDRQQLKNDIVEMQYSMLTSEDAALSIFTPQDISPLKAIASDINPSYKNIPYSMTEPEGQFYFQNQNMVGKQMVAVSASTNASHAIGSMADVRMIVPDIRFNGMSLSGLSTDGYTRVDSIVSEFDKSTIGRSTAGFVGASADNAKDPIDASVGYQKKVANFYTGLVRLGVPVRTVSLLLSQPVVGNIVSMSEEDNTSFEKALEGIVMDTAKNAGYSAEDIKYAAEGMDFIDNELIDNIRNPKKNYNDKILFSLYALKDTMNSISRVTDLYKLNSTQNAVGPDPWKTLKNMLKFSELDRDLRDKDNPLSKVKAGSIESIYDNIPFIPILKKVYTDLVPKFLGEYFPAFSPAYIGLLDYMNNMGLSIGRMSEKNMRNMFKEFTVYYGTGRINGETLIDGSYNNRQRLFYDLPVSIIKRRAQFKRTAIMSALDFKLKASKRDNLSSLSINTSNMSVEDKDRLSMSWWTMVSPTSMVYNRTKQLGMDLFEYSIFRTGFYFSPVGFISLAPNLVKNTYNNGAYTKLAKAENWSTELFPEDYFNFLQQYARNHPNGQYTHICKMENLIETKSGVQAKTDYKIPSNAVILMVGKSKKLYVRNAQNSDLFVPVTKLGFNNQGFEYNRLEKGSAMKTVNSRDTFNKTSLEYMKFIKESQEESIDEYEDNTYDESAYEEPEADLAEDKASALIARGVSIQSTDLQSAIDSLLSDRSVREWLNNAPSQVDESLYSDNLELVKDTLYELVKEGLGGERFNTVRSKVKKTLDRIC